jgi:hypothetical protein
MSGQAMSGQAMSGQAMNDGPPLEDELRSWSQYLGANGCLPDRVCRAVAGGLPIPGGFLPIPIAFTVAAERLAGAAEYFRSDMRTPRTPNTPLNVTYHAVISLLSCHAVSSGRPVLRGT